MTQEYLIVHSVLNRDRDKKKKKTVTLGIWCQKYSMIPVPGDRHEERVKTELWLIRPDTSLHVNSDKTCVRILSTIPFLVIGN